MLFSTMYDCAGLPGYLVAKLMPWLISRWSIADTRRTPLSYPLPASIQLQAQGSILVIFLLMQRKLKICRGLGLCKIVAVDVCAFVNFENVF